MGVHAFTDFDLYTNAAMRTTSSVSLEDLLLNGILGAVGEMGEIVEQVKKHLFQGHELNKDKMVEELGDVLWYIASISRGLDADLSYVARVNIAKLAARYPDGTFSTQHSIERDVERERCAREGV